MEQAEEILRVKLGNKATKAASRITADGVVAIYIDEPGKIGAIVERKSRKSSNVSRFVFGDELGDKIGRAHV